MKNRLFPRCAKIDGTTYLALKLDLYFKYFYKLEVASMNKHLQQKQIFDSFFSDEELPITSEEDPCIDPECVDEEQIYEIIDHNGYSDISMDELELDDYDDFMEL